MLKIYNTLTKQKEDFKPIKDGEVSVYQCGPTVYWTQHIGNMRAVFVGDIVFRTLKYIGYDVKFARNYTDVGHLTSDGDSGEDKMEKGAKRDNLTPKEVADKYIKQYDVDVEKLNALLPDFRPKATDYIEQIKEMVTTLLEKGFAYETDLAVYFDTSKAKDYTRISGQKLEENKAESGHGDVYDDQKKNPADFAVWFYKKGKHENALQTWSSPGSRDIEGFPGWHIECSSMIKDLFGNTIDIHLGGIEHIPVHHTNEIAQSESANDSDFVNYWIHYEHLLVNNKKMAKSDGTSYVLDDIIEKGYSPADLRFFFLQAQYRSKQNFTWEALEAASNGLKKIKKVISDLSNNDINPDQKFIDKFKDKISDDFNTPQALSIVYEVLDSDLESSVKKATILNFDQILGLNLDSTDKENIPQEIQELAEKREEARKSGNFETSDKLRDEIENKGYRVKDTDQGPEVEKV